MAGDFFQTDSGTVAAGDTTVSFEVPVASVFVRAKTSGSSGDLSVTLSPGGATFQVPGGDWHVANGRFRSLVLSDGGAGAAEYEVAYGEAQPVASHSSGSVSGSISSAEIASGAVTNAKMAANSVDSDQYVDGSIDNVHVAEDQLTGGKVANVADDNATPGIPVVHVVAVAGGADANEDITIDDKLEVYDAVVRLDGGGTTGSQVTIQNGADAISNAIDVSGGSDTDVFRPGQLDDDHTAIAAGGTLRVAVASSGANFPPATVFIHGVKRA